MRQQRQMLSHFEHQDDNISHPNTHIYTRTKIIFARLKLQFSTIMDWIYKLNNIPRHMETL
jgi:hypothetical protein